MMMLGVPCVRRCSYKFKTIFCNCEQYILNYIVYFCWYVFRGRLYHTRSYRKQVMLENIGFVIGMLYIISLCRYRAVKFRPLFLLLQNLFGERAAIYALVQRNVERFMIQTFYIPLKHHRNSKIMVLRFQKQNCPVYKVYLKCKEL